MKIAAFKRTNNRGKVSYIEADSVEYHNALLFGDKLEALVMLSDVCSFDKKSKSANYSNELKPDTDSESVFKG